MKVSVYGDAHITRKMGGIQSFWNTSVVQIFRNLYNSFESDSVEMAVCLGDLFDKAVLEAKSVRLVLEVLSIINRATFPTYILLGNHEIDNNEQNILEYITEYDNIIPVTELKTIEDKFTFIPYSVSIEDLSPDVIEGMYVFTHHDIYGSELANGVVKASFGIDPNLLSTAKRVFNGHIHLSSRLGNIINAGSVTKMQQGELRVGETPYYYYLDTTTGAVSSIPITKNFIAYVTVSTLEQIGDLLSEYDDSVKLSVRIKYKDDLDLSVVDSYRKNPRILSISLRKTISDSLNHTDVVKKSSVNMEEFLSNYIRNDEEVPDIHKESLISLGLSLLRVGASC